MSTIILWSLRRALTTAAMLTVVILPVSVQADSPKKSPGPCEIHYPSDALVECDCRLIPPCRSLEAVFAEYWVDIARFTLQSDRLLGLA